MDRSHLQLPGAVGVEVDRVRVVRPCLLSRLFVFIDGAAFPARGDLGRAFYKRSPFASMYSSRRTMSATLARAQVWGSGRGMGGSVDVGVWHVSGLDA